MSLITETQGTINISVVDDYLLTWMEAFLIDRKAVGVTDGTLRRMARWVRIALISAEPMSSG